MQHDLSKQKIIELVPEIKRLHFGLPILYEGKEGIFCTVANSFGYWNIHMRGNANAKHVEAEKVEIVYRITLADVLRAIAEASVYEFHVYQGGQLWYRGQYNMIDWNLTTDYDGQTQEVKTFIGSLLGL